MTTATRRAAVQPSQVSDEHRVQLQSPEVRAQTAQQLRGIADRITRGLARGRPAERADVEALQRGINLYTNSARLEVDGIFGRHTERALTDVQDMLDEDRRVSNRRDIGGGRAAGPTLRALADALSQGDVPANLTDRMATVHAQRGVRNPIGTLPPNQGAVPTPPEDVPRGTPRGDPEAIAAARQLGQIEHSPIGSDQPEAAALRDRVRALPADARPRTLDALATEVGTHPAESRGRFAATLLTSLDNADGTELYNRIAPRANEPGRLTPGQHLDMARSIGRLEGNGGEHAAGLPANALTGLNAAIRERALSPQGTDADRDAAANLRAEVIRRGAEQPVDVRDQAQRDALLADLRFARGGTEPDGTPGATPSPDDAIAARIPESSREHLTRSVLDRLEKAEPPADAAGAQAYRTQLRSILSQVPESMITDRLGERLREPPAGTRGVVVPGTIVQQSGDRPPERTADAVPTAADLARLRQGGDPAAYQQAVTRIADQVRANVAEDRARIGVANPTLDGMSPEVLGDLDRHLTGTLAATPENAGAAATVRAAAMRARAGESYDLDTDPGRERLARDATFAFGPDRSRSLSTAFMERNPEDPVHSALPDTARAQLQRDLLARLEPVVGRAANPAVAAALGNVAPPEGDLAGRFTRLRTIARGGDVTDAAVTAAQRGFAGARGMTTRPMEGLAAELDRLDQLGGPPGEDRRAAIDRIARTAMQGPLSRRHEITRDLLATMNPADAARLWEGIRPRRADDPPTVAADGEHRYTTEQLAALGMTIGASTPQPGGENRALANLPPAALRDIDASMAAGFANNTDRLTMAAAATIRAATLRAQAREQQALDLRDPQQAGAMAERLRILSTPRADGGYDDRVAAAMHADVRTQLRNAELARLGDAPVPTPSARRQLAAYQAGLRTALAGAGDQIDPVARGHLDTRLGLRPMPADDAARHQLANLDATRAAALTRSLEEWRARGPDGVADAADLAGAITRELSPTENETAAAATERQRRLGLITAAGDTPTVRDIRAGVDTALVARARAYSQTHLPGDGRPDTRPNLADHQHNELSDALLRADLSQADPQTRFAALHLRMERLQRGKPEDLAANVAFAFNLPHAGGDGRPQPTMSQLLEAAGATANPQVAERVQADARRMIATSLREHARTNADARRILEATRAALPASSPERRLLEGQAAEAPTPRVRPQPDQPVVRDRTGTLSLANLGAAGPDLNIPHYVQPDGSTCIPTTLRMIRARDGHVGRERVGNNEAVRFDGPLLQRVLTQLQTTGIQLGVRSREGPGASIRGSDSGHVVALTGYEFVNAQGRRVANADVQAAVAATGGDWNRLLGALDSRGIRLRLNINDPGINSRSPGARSHLDVNPTTGLISRPRIGDRYVSLGHYTVRYFMLD
ncbi:MAG: hypothetical protein ACAI38_05160 [Myxococcota bacterium]